jgi:hypothetical protein
VVRRVISSVESTIPFDQLQNLWASAVRPAIFRSRAPMCAGRPLRVSQTSYIEVFVRESKEEPMEDTYSNH